MATAANATLTCLKKLINKTPFTPVLFWIAGLFAADRILERQSKEKLLLVIFRPGAE
jgi:hypothetical protein